MTDNPAWDQLLDEHRTLVMGPLWLKLLEDVVRSVTPRYPPSVYSETGEWNQHARENLVQDVTVHQLLEQHQLSYIVDSSTSTSMATALLHRLVRRTLAHNRRRTVIDNILDRCRTLHSFESTSGPGPSNERLLEAVRHVARIPRVGIHKEERAPSVYTTDSLRDILRIAEDHLGSSFSERDLAKILEHVLTSYLPSALEQIDARTHAPSPELGPDQEAVVADVLSELFSSMSQDQRTVVAMKLADRSDTEVAHQFGISRPTAAKRFREAAKFIETAVVDLPTRVQDAVLRELPYRLEADLPIPASNSDRQAPTQETHE